MYSYDDVLLNEETAPIDMGTYNYRPSTTWKRNYSKNVLAKRDTFDMDFEKDVARDEANSKIAHTFSDVGSYWVLANTGEEEEFKERDEAIKKSINEFFEEHLSGSKERYKENNKYRH